jgi:hypothetical protein
MFNTLKLSIFTYFLLTVNSYAYLDPGTGSLILSFLAACFAFLSIFFYKIKKFFLKIFKNDKKNNSQNKNETK